jgi:hypothetical protein
MKVVTGDTIQTRQFGNHLIQSSRLKLCQWFNSTLATGSLQLYILFPIQKVSFWNLQVSTYVYSYSENYAAIDNKFNKGAGWSNFYGDVKGAYSKNHILRW